MSERFLAAFVQSWVGLAIGLFACLLLRRTAASVRCWVWRGVLLKAMLALLIVVPVVVERSSPIVAPLLPPVPSATEPAGESLPTPSAPVKPPIDPLPIVYGLGVAVVIGLRAAGSRRVHRAMPRVVGALRPQVVVPEGLPVAELEMARAHESAHVRRRDPLWSLFGDACSVLLWFAPPVWIAAAAMRAEAEAACDAEAVRETSAPPRAYAQLLLAFAGPAPANALGGSARRLARRIVMLNRPTKPLSRSFLAVFVIFGFAALLPWQAIAAQAGPDAGPLHGGGGWQPAVRVRFDSSLDTMLFEPGVKEKIGWTPEETAALEARNDRWNKAFRAWADPHLALQKSMVLSEWFKKDARERPLAFAAADKAAGPQVWTPEQGRTLKSMALARFGSGVWDSPEIRDRLKLDSNQLSHLLVENQDISLEYLRRNPAGVLKPLKTMTPAVRAKIARLNSIYLNAPPEHRQEAKQKLWQLRQPYEMYRRRDEHFDEKKEMVERIARTWQLRTAADKRMTARLNSDQQAMLKRLINDPDAWKE